MREPPAGGAAAALFEVAATNADDLTAACLALIGAALATCQLGLRRELPQGAADLVEASLTAAGATLLDPAGVGDDPAGVPGLFAWEPAGRA